SGVESPYNFVLLIQQSETERLLEEQLETLGVKVERRVELQSFKEGESSITGRIAHADGSEEQIEASWLIGCDGAHSTVRHGLGMDFQGSTMLNDWVLADVHISERDGVPAIDIYWHAKGVL